MARAESETLSLDGHEVTITNPGKLFFADAGITKLDLVRYYLAVADGAIVGVRDRPMALKRFVDGADGEAFFQKRAPKSVPEYVRTVELSFPSGRTADEVVVDNHAALAWVVNLGCVDLNPHPVRSGDLDHPDELRVDLDPGPGVPWADVRSVALVVREVLEELGYTAWPKTSGSRGIHVYVRLEPRWGFSEVRRSALAIAREVERRAPSIATSKWWKEERHGVFLDYNQNAKDRTVASVYSVRPRPSATVSAPLTWDEVPDAELEDFTLKTVPERYARLGDVGAGIDAKAHSLEPLLELVARHEAEGRGRRAVAAELREAARRAAARPALEAPDARSGRADADRPDRPARPRRLGGAGDALGAGAQSRWHRPADRTPPLDAAAPRHQPGRRQGRCARRPRSLARSPPRGGGARSRPGGSARGRDARALQGLVAGPGQPAERAGEAAAGGGAARPRLRPVGGVIARHPSGRAGPRSIRRRCSA